LLPYSLSGIRPGAEHLGHAPGLGNAGARDVRFLAVEDFADRSDTRFAEMRRKCAQKLARFSVLAGMELQPRVDIWPNQPSPYRTLMIRGISRTQVAVITALVIRIRRAEGAQSHRCQ